MAPWLLRLRNAICRVARAAGDASLAHRAPGRPVPAPADSGPRPGGWPTARDDSEATPGPQIASAGPVSVVKYSDIVIALLYQASARTPLPLYISAT